KTSMSVIKLFGSLAAFLVVLIVPVFSQPTKVLQESSTLKVPVDLVLLDVSVHDKHGQLVRDLEQKDFRVYEDKLEQPIASFSSEESPVTWGLILDRSSSMKAMMKDVYESAVNVIDHGTNEDEMCIMTFNNRTEIASELTS